MSDNKIEANEKIFIPDEDGVEHEFEVILPFELDETNASYIAVVPIEQLEDEEADLYVFRYEEADEDLKIFQIETDEEWDLVEEVLNTIL